MVKLKGTKMKKKPTKAVQEEKKPKLLRRTRDINFETGEITERYPEVMTIDEVSKLLRVTPRAVYHLVRDKKIPALKVGTKFRFYRRAVFEAMSKIPE
jgi:excisionase family DNA binding protein